jgi:acyl phosphate:glycerol-3-phosphate acyltransferase
VPALSYIVTAFAAYLFGSIPTGFLVGRARGIDIRTVGSGNIGATNTMRVLGKPAGIFVLLVDAAKGFAACFLGVFIYSYYFNQFNGLHSTSDIIPFPSQEGVERFAIVAGIFSVLGHNYPCWLKFKGGKGIATTTGVYLALAPWAVLIGLVVFLLAILVTRYVSVGSIAAAIALPLTICLTQNGLLLDVVTIALAALAIYKHKSNLQRLRNGTENRITFKKKDSQ